MDGSAIAFYVFAALTVIASLGVVGQRNPMYSVMLLITSFAGLAGLYVLLDSPFSAVTQIIIYAGAIMVLFLFVVMLLNVPREEPGPLGLIASLRGPRALRIGALLSVLLGVEIVWALSRVGVGWFGQDEAATSVSDVSRIGYELFTRHAFAFEATSILILVAMVGAVVIARRER
ncbi:MAG TPA: NADH-quinone oxidoreductase subunit J [Vicinamibacterales bacterium]|nr:NADH-quinone oxidoreductase subunit J [Vicinamibacterales bacterium]